MLAAVVETSWWRCQPLCRAVLLLVVLLVVVLLPLCLPHWESQSRPVFVEWCCYYWQWQWRG